MTTMKLIFFKASNIVVSSPTNAVDEHYYVGLMHGLVTMSCASAVLYECSADAVGVLEVVGR